MAGAPRLYLVTPTGLAAEDLADKAGALLVTGAVACLRLDLGPAAEEEDWLRAANLLLPLAHGAEVPLLATDRAELVERLGLDGVHLTEQGPALGPLRKRLGKDVILGASGGAERHRAMSLAEGGADYVAIGPATGPEAAAAEQLLAWWAEVIEVPSVAEGGVTPDVAKRLGETADFIVPGSELWAAPDPAAALKAYEAALGA